MLAHFFQVLFVIVQFITTAGYFLLAYMMFSV